jgi:hypothetical protein
LAENLVRYRAQIGAFSRLPASMRDFLLRLRLSDSLSAKLQRGNAGVSFRFANVEQALTRLPPLLDASLREWRAAPGKWRPAQADLVAMLGSRRDVNAQPVGHADQLRQ